MVNTINRTTYDSCGYKGQLGEISAKLSELRAKNIDAKLSDVVKKTLNMDMLGFYQGMGIDPSSATIKNLMELPDVSVRFLVPEMIMDALRLGLRRAPIWPNIIAGEQPVSQTTVVMPHIDMADSAPRYVGEAESIPIGDISYGQKTVKIHKIGRGIKISYEVREYVAINMVSVFLQDMGFKLGHALDTLAIDTLINGDQTDGSESAAVVGIGVPTAMEYEDLLRVWLRMGRIGRTPDFIIGGETMAINTLMLEEFKQRYQGTTDKTLEVITPIPQRASYAIHGAVPANQQIVIDSQSALIKLNAKPLMVESERIVSNQTEATYASLTTGFANIFRDGRVIMDQSLDFASNGFPAFMDVDAFETVEIK
jgi:hypothetical protein